MDKNNFKDHFSVNSEKYSKYRPDYPAALFKFLSSLTPGQDLAWDCATGSGQAAHGLVQIVGNLLQVALREFFVDLYQLVLDQPGLGDKNHQQLAG